RAPRSTRRCRSGRRSASSGGRGPGGSTRPNKREPLGSRPRPTLGGGHAPPGEIQMIPRVVILVAGFPATAPAMAQAMSNEALERFVIGKYFAFSCFEGSRGVGRIENDGSITGTLLVSGAGPTRPIQLPPGTLEVKDVAVCITLQSSKSEQCFNLNRTGE